MNKSIVRFSIDSDKIAKHIKHYQDQDDKMGMPKSARADTFLKEAMEAYLFNDSHEDLIIKNILDDAMSHVFEWFRKVTL